MGKSSLSILVPKNLNSPGLHNAPLLRLADLGMLVYCKGFYVFL